MLINIKKVCGIIPKIISKQNLIYLGLSLLFIPIALLIKWINFGFYFNILIIMAICSLFYAIILFLIKDENINIMLQKVMKIIKKFLKGKENNI